MHVARKVRQKFTYGLVLKYLFDKLADVGLKIMPCYLVQEGIFKEDPLEIHL
jgi:hypothetical protein